MAFGWISLEPVAWRLPRPQAQGRKWPTIFLWSAGGSLPPASGWQVVRDESQRAGCCL